MPTKTLPPVPDSLRLFLADAVERGNVGTQEVLAVLQVLAWAENEAQMGMYVQMLRVTLPFMASYEGNHEGNSELLDWLKPRLARLIQKDPTSASSIMRRAVEPGMTIAQLGEEFPVLKETRTS